MASPFTTPFTFSGTPCLPIPQASRMPHACLTIFTTLTRRSELPSNLIIKKASPKIWLPFLTFAWGVVTIGIGFMQNYATYMALRAILGLFEGGLVPGMILYMSGMYTRGELALRIGIFYTAASLSGAFGGLLARGLSAIGPRGGLEGWRWIFIMEGLIVSTMLSLRCASSNRPLDNHRCRHILLFPTRQHRDRDVSHQRGTCMGCSAPRKRRRRAFQVR